MKGDPLPLHYTSTLTDNNNVYGENVGKKVTGKQITEKKSWIKSHRKKRHKKKVTVKKVTYIMTSLRQLNLFVKIISMP